MSISTNISQQIYLLNEKIRAVLSLAFQNFHTIFEELNRVYEQFQVGFNPSNGISIMSECFFSFQHELDRQLKILIEQLTIDMKNDLDGNQGKFTTIERDLLSQMKTCFQEMVCEEFKRCVLNDPL